ncbi:MAG: pyridoxamine 5'-phosphate oxidase family protein [Deltaproteobacteria bacterium]|nr:pyridoxamine 5'-phosphate oxidase family protein [Deltaproteobacteria bacterium]
MLGELSAEQIEDVLRTGMVGRIGLHADGRTYVVPVTYVYDGAAVIGHTGVGLKVRMARANPAVCFEVDAFENMANWRSVIAWGRFEELHGAEAGLAMKRLVDRFLPLMTSESAQPLEASPPGGSSIDRAARGRAARSLPDSEPATSSPGAHGMSSAHRADTAGHEAVIYRIHLDEKTGRFEKR